MSLKSTEILKKKRLGEILKSLNMLDDEKLNEILEKQQCCNLKLGEVLTSMGYVDQEILLSLVGKQLGSPYIKVSEYGSIPADVLGLIPRRIAELHMIIPFEQQGNVLKLAMADPQEEEIRSAVSILTNMEVESYITSEDEIIKAIGNNY